MPILISCQHCNKSFSVIPSKRNARFCSRDCQHKHGKPRKIRTHTCSICGNTFKNTKARSWLCSDECRTKSYQSRQDNRRNQIDHICKSCGKTFSRPASRSPQYCSRTCHGKGVTKNRTGKIRTSTTIPCTYCNNPVKRFKCRIEAYGRSFCNKDCYHKWDTKYKSLPHNRDASAKRLLKVRQSMPKVSKVEDMVAAWLDQHGIAYERQYPFRFYSIDFKVRNIFIEVNGCYWHGCATCFPKSTLAQKKVQRRDRAKATFSRNRGYTLYTIWEHDVRDQNFTALMPILNALP